jgi:protoporphyrinogen oxidase
MDWCQADTIQRDGVVPGRIPVRARFTTADECKRARQHQGRTARPKNKKPTARYLRPGISDFISKMQRELASTGRWTTSRSLAMSRWQTGSRSRVEVWE